MKKDNSGLFLVNKEAGMTSRRVSNLIGRKFNTRKVGHLGTLDPLATGLLIVAINEGTKLLPYIEDGDKTYAATFKLGLLTSTLDLEGEVISEVKLDPFPSPLLSETISKFSGEITQIPPLTSAIKVDGKRLYDYAHAGEVVSVPPRKVTIHDIRLVNYIHPFFSVITTVSKGTYIRTLGDDIAQVLKTNATTTSLERVSIGKYKVSEAKRIDELELSDLITLEKVLPFPIVELDDFYIKRVRNGQSISVERNEPFIQIHDYDGNLVAICRKNETIYEVVRGFN